MINSLCLWIHCKVDRYTESVLLLSSSVACGFNQNHSTAKYEPYGLIKSAVRYQHQAWQFRNSDTFRFRIFSPNQLQMVWTPSMEKAVNKFNQFNWERKKENVALSQLFIYIHVNLAHRPCFSTAKVKQRFRRCRQVAKLHSLKLA